MGEGLIRKIIVGPDPKNALAYVVGMNAGDGYIDAILEDMEFLQCFNKTRYLIYVQNSEGNNLWKTIQDVPCVLEYDLKF